MVRRRTVCGPRWGTVVPKLRGHSEARLPTKAFLVELQVVAEVETLVMVDDTTWFVAAKGDYSTAGGSLGNSFETRERLSAGTMAAVALTVDGTALRQSSFSPAASLCNL